MDGPGRSDDLGEMLTDADPQTAKRVMEAMLKMKKMDIARLKDTYINGD